MRAAALVLGVLLTSCIAAAPAHALRVEAFRGHMALGYGKLLGVADAPGGSLSAEGGIDYPVAKPLRLGVVVGYHLLGSRTEERGSLVANLDYSAFTAALLLHWKPENLGPVALLSAGPALVNAHVDLSSSGGGANFSDLALAETAPGLALGATLMKKAETPVRIGFELGATFGFLEGVPNTQSWKETWMIATARVAFHY